MSCAIPENMEGTVLPITSLSLEINSSSASKVLNISFIPNLADLKLFKVFADF
jgi:hypothetical protein